MLAAQAGLHAGRSRTAETPPEPAPGAPAGTQRRNGGLEWGELHRPWSAPGACPVLGEADETADIAKSTLLTDAVEKWDCRSVLLVPPIVGVTDFKDHQRLFSTLARRELLMSDITRTMRAAVVVAVQVCGARGF